MVWALKNKSPPAKLSAKKINDTQMHQLEDLGLLWCIFCVFLAE